MDHDNLMEIGKSIEEGDSISVNGLDVPVEVYAHQIIDVSEQEFGADDALIIHIEAQRRDHPKKDHAINVYVQIAQGRESFVEITTGPINMEDATGMLLLDYSNSNETKENITKLKVHN